MSSRSLKMKISGRFIDLLGNQMYGGPVPSISEFIANAWDADATKMEIQIPKTISVNSAEISIQDYGTGMSFSDLQDYYLQVGYERRKVKGNKTDAGRLVMGRKGIGKLAGFGIAEIINIRSVRNKHVVSFELDYNKIKELTHIEDLNIDLIEDGATTENNGVKITLKKLKLSKNINIDNFKKSIARRFAINSDQMKILVNGSPITKEKLDFEYKTNWEKAILPDVGELEYWYGFTKRPISDYELRGLTIFARQRIAQTTPFFFNLTGGINGQVGLEYLTGQMKAEFLDNEEFDYIATGRQSINWNFEKTIKLQDWGQALIKRACADWKKRKDNKNIEIFKHNYSEYYERINGLPSQEKNDLIMAFDKIATLERIEPDDFKIIANSMLEGVERESVKKVIRKINATRDDALEDLFKTIKEWDIISAVSIAEVVSGKVEIIKKFEEHIKNRIPEKAPKGQIDMQVFIKEYPWLLGNEFESLKATDFVHESGVDKWIEDELKQVKTNDIDDGHTSKRFDLLILKDNYQILIIELMKPNIPADWDHVNRLKRYVRRINSKMSGSDTREKYRYRRAYGLLIADKLAKDASLKEEIDRSRDVLEAVEWESLLATVKSRYKEFYASLKLKAPNDPRLKGVPDL